MKFCPAAPPLTPHDLRQIIFRAADGRDEIYWYCTRCAWEPEDPLVPDYHDEWVDKSYEQERASE
jgi:hypothetical protein